MTIDENMDIGLDTGTGVDDSYQLPFKFTGTIDKLTFKLGPSQLMPADQKAVMASALPVRCAAMTSAAKGAKTSTAFR